MRIPEIAHQLPAIGTPHAELGNEDALVILVEREKRKDALALGILRFSRQQRHEILAPNAKLLGLINSSHRQDRRKPVQVGRVRADPDTRFDLSRPAHKGRHANRIFPHVGTLVLANVSIPGNGVVQNPLSVAFVPDTVMPHVVTVVGGVDDDGILREPALVERLHDSAEVSVHASRRGEVLFHPPIDLFSVEIGVVRNIRPEILDIVRCHVLWRHRKPLRVRRPGMPGDKKRILLLAGGVGIQA